MLPSVEVRWFGRGAIPEVITDWFYQAELPPESESNRDDYYLRLAGIETIGVKLRQGNIEQKVRQQPPASGGLHPFAEGQVEHWRKWSFKLNEHDANLDAIANGDADWVRVAKERLLRKYAITDGQVVTQVRIGDRPAEGCNLELTRIRVGGDAVSPLAAAEWWTIGFESFGTETAIADHLRMVVKHVFSKTQALPLRAEASYGYPHWLNLLAR
jgi:hypothetical protein